MDKAPRLFITVDESFNDGESFYSVSKALNLITGLLKRGGV